MWWNVVVDRGTITLRKLVQRLKETYCGPIGWEFMHIPDVEQCNFLRERVSLALCVVLCCVVACERALTPSAPFPPLPTD
jgi:hypothetical protein